MLSYNEKEKLRKNILLLEEYEQYHILNILKKHNINYSSNSSGIRFIDGSCTEEVLMEINDYVNNKIKNQ